MWKLYAIVLLVCAFCACAVRGFSEYHYAHQRDVLQEEERKFAGDNAVLSQDEKIVNSYLEYLKWAEFERTRDAFPPARPIEQVLDNIKGSYIYSVLKKLPKGGNMHTHMHHLLSKRAMLEHIFNSTLLDLLCVDTRPGTYWTLEFYETPPAGLVKVTSNVTAFSIDNILQHITLINVLSDAAKAHPTDSRVRWQDMQPIFGAAGSEIVRLANYTRWHVKAVLEAALAENVQYVESRVGHHDLYYADDSASQGHLYPGDGSNTAWYTMVREIVSEVTAEHPQFIGFREIVSGKRFKSAESVKQELDRAIKLRQTWPDIVGGFDIVAEEDQGYSILFYLDDFDDSFQKAHLPLYFHTSETNWPNDLLTSLHTDDPVSTADNIYEAVILGSKRVGHGIGFINHPYMMQVLKDRKIAVEANPVSNMLLGYVTDQRHHPAITYLRYGIPVVLGADDPGSMGYDEFTVDWYEAFMGWGLNLGDLKRLAQNSLTYSTLTDQMKTFALYKWTGAWKAFIDEMKHEACAANFTSAKPEVHRIYPSDGPLSEATKVRVFGRNFQPGICQRVICQFGGKQTHGQYVYNTMITCPSPANQLEESVPFSISLDYGNNFLSTNLTFTYTNMNATSGFNPSIVG